MTKRIVSGIFILTALGALGVILAGALTSGEQLIVRFLTAVIVAALGLYVISDLRLQADDDAAGGIRSGGQPRLAGISAPPNSTAAFMATVTGKGDSPAPVDQIEDQDELAGDEDSEPTRTVVGTTSSSTSEHEASAVVEDAGSLDVPPVPSLLGPAPVTVRASELPNLTGPKQATITDLFARRSRGDAIDRTWPTFGSDPSPSSPDIETTGTDEWDDGPEDVYSEAQPTDGGAETMAGAATDSTVDVTVAAETTDLPADAMTQFEYSGELEAPVFEWPAAPAAEAPETPTVATGEADETETPSGQDQDEPAGKSDEVATFDRDGDDEADRALPSPFLAAAGTSAVEYADAPLAPIIDLRNAAGSTPSEVEVAISSGELEVIAALIDQGMLSTDGPISDRDVRTMVYVAFTSNELRKLLMAGGTPDSPNPEIDLGPVELFKDGLVQPPKTLYAGPPVEAEARSQLG